MSNGTGALAQIPQGEGEGHELPRIQLTFEQVKKEIDENRGSRPECPDAVIKAIIRSDDPHSKIREMKTALDSIAKAAGTGAWGAFNSLSNDKLASLFIQDPQKLITAYGEIAKAAGTGAGSAFNSLSNDEIAECFLDYCNKKITFNQFMTTILSSDNVAIELGRPLDDLHFNEPERKKYLASLSTLQVFSLLNSNPEFFYTSSNHMLFDRLKKDLGEKSVTQLFEEYGLIGTDQCRNFLLRAINYGRFYGQQDSVLNEQDVNSLLPTLLQPLSSKEFDQTYFFLLANAIDDMKNIPSLREKIKAEVESRLKTAEDKRLKSALEFIAYELDQNTPLISQQKKQSIRELESDSTYNPELYKNNGKLTVLQVFDKEDTGKDHWGMTIDWFTKYFGKAPSKGDNGELIFENSTTKMILFMGDEDSQNQEFIRQQLQKTPNMIATFRGHSYSLNDSFPPDIFGNREGHILFIPGSCGSAGSTPEYLSANPNTDLSFVSNTSTGMGQVTNSIVEALMGSPAKEFQEIIADTTKIEAHGGNVSTIKVWTKGESLIKYVQQQ